MGNSEDTQQKLTDGEVTAERLVLRPLGKQHLERTKPRLVSPEYREPA